MQLQHMPTETGHYIQEYDTHGFRVQGQYYAPGVLVSGEQVSPLATSVFDAKLIEKVVALSPTLVIFGTAEPMNIPALAPLIAANIGWEVMNVASACGTYNFLLAEGRDVAACLTV
jgi:uncharacterized protein